MLKCIQHGHGESDILALTRKVANIPEPVDKSEYKRLYKSLETKSANQLPWKPDTWSLRRQCHMRLRAEAVVLARQHKNSCLTSLNLLIQTDISRTEYNIKYIH